MKEGYRGPHAASFTYVGAHLTPERHALAVATVVRTDKGVEVFVGAPDSESLLKALAELDLLPVHADRFQDIKIYPQRHLDPYVAAPEIREAP